MPSIVKQRLKLAAVSPQLLDVYAADGMTLEQLMAFTVTNDAARQEQVWEQISRGHNTESYYIRRQLTEGAVRAMDRRALFVGVEAYEAAGGVVTRDLFEHDGGGWLQDPALLDGLVIEKLKAEADKVREEGWKWIAVATDFPYGHTAGLRRLHGRTVELPEEETAARNALKLNSTASSSGTRTPKTCRRRSTGGSGKSKPRWRRSMTGPSPMIPPRSRLLALSSALTARACCGSSAAMSVPRTN